MLTLSLVLTDKNTSLFLLLHKPCFAGVVTDENWHYILWWSFYREAEVSKRSVNVTEMITQTASHLFFWYCIDLLLISTLYTPYFGHFSKNWTSLFGATGNYSMSITQRHNSADVSRHWNLIMAFQLSSGLLPFSYFSHLWFQQPGNPGQLQNIISLMDRSTGWQEWMIALWCHLPQTVHWHK